ncbi:hypothetical protein A5666_24415 [Mycolicibacterium fortuitum]|uniref:tyrosine-type recombinase/integrase n=1 Tax=Mycolicibacterium fortuitum TaxID=1766 RepID=UPI0007EA95FB|nr:site-specific integrase [Mycolicibacterium fortuitum]OBA98627.1 hypothetical protein A5665_24535 [Mycolicibacterium fortuitum]OBI69906.1 hypothetical protein A5666_24415 [Mycolicibacterium fortuitum]
MAYIRELTNGKHQVCWRENARDDYGAPIKGKFVQRTETVDTAKQAERRKVAIELEIESGGQPSASADRASQPVAHYARMYFDALTSKIDQSTLEGYREIYRVHIKPTFGNRPVCSILPSDVDTWTSALMAGRSDSTVKQALGVLRRIMRKAVLDKAIDANPTTEVKISTSTKQRADRQPFKHCPLNAGQIAAVADYISTEQGNPVFGLAVTFAGFTGVRAAELQGLTVGDLDLNPLNPSVSVTRTKTRRKTKDCEWITSTPKSAKGIRSVPLDQWLAADLRAYLTDTHPNASDPTAVLFPGRLNRHRASQLKRKFSDPLDMLDWDNPIVCDFAYETNFKRALQKLAESHTIPSDLTRARWHDLRHSFAVMSLSGGEHYMQVSKWLGHATFTLTLDTYGDYISSVEGGKAAPLARPVAVTPQTNNVVPLQRKAY